MEPTYWKGLALLFSVKIGSHWNNQRFDESCEMRRNIETTETEKHKQVFFSKFMLRHGVLQVFVSFCVLDFVRVILTWCP